MYWGDNMTKFFFRYATEKATINRIRCRKTDAGNWITEHEEMTSHTVKFFQHLFSRPHAPNNSHRSQVVQEIISKFRRRLSHDDIQWLSQPFSEKEVKVAFFGINAWKASDPDGILALFYHKL